MDQQTEKTYIEYRNHLLESRRKSYEQFDKAIFFLSGGTLTVSLALIDKIVPLSQAQSKYFLFATWVCETISLVLTLCSFVSSYRATDTQLEIADAYFINDDDDAFSKRNCWSITTKYFNYVAALLFISGLTALLVFVFINVV